MGKSSFLLHQLQETFCGRGKEMAGETSSQRHRPLSCSFPFFCNHAFDIAFVLRVYLESKQKPNYHLLSFFLSFFSHTPFLLRALIPLASHTLLTSSHVLHSAFLGSTCVPGMTPSSPTRVPGDLPLHMVLLACTTHTHKHIHT